MLGIKTKIKINTETITSIKEKALFLFIIEIFLSKLELIYNKLFFLKIIFL